MQSLVAAIAALTVGLALGPAAQARSLESGVQIAVHQQQEARFVRVNEHDFHIKPITFRQRDHRDGTARVLVEGQLSHHLRFRPDDQYYYRIDLCGVDGTVMSFDEHTNAGGWANTLLTPRTIRVLSLDGNIDSVAQLEEAARVISRELSSYVDGSWHESARFVALRVAAEVAAEVRPRVRDHRTGRNPRAQSACFQPRVTITR
jgi:hypothetical protein